MAPGTGQLRALLAEARGENEWVVASMIDIRGFTSYPMEAVQAALFLQLVYLRILDEYVREDAFVKLTGDGVLVVEPYTPGELGLALDDAVGRWLKLDTEFPRIAAGNPEIRFPVPTKIGIGVDHGAASRLLSGEVTIDFFGTPLNTSARLCDLARPRGIVISDTTAMESALRRRFGRQAGVYLKGMGESAQRTVYYLKRETVIPAYALQPFDEPEFEQDSHDVAVTILRRLAGNVTTYDLDLRSRPLDHDLSVRVWYTLRGLVGRAYSDLEAGTHYRYELDPNGPTVRFFTVALLEKLEEQGVGPRSSVVLSVRYRKRSA